MYKENNELDFIKKVVLQKKKGCSSKKSRKKKNDSDVSTWDPW